MKKITRTLMTAGVILLAFFIFFSGCKKKEEETKITGTASFLAGTSGDLSNAKVSLYTTYDNWLYNSPVRYVTASGAGASITFEIKDVLPGNYYLDIWKDIDNSSTWTSGDFVGWYGSGGLGSEQLTEFQITEGQTFSIDVRMYIIAKGDPLAK